MHKNAQKFARKIWAKLPVTRCGCSMVKFAHLDDAFSEFFELEASPVEGRLLQQKDKERRKRKGAKKSKKLKSLKTMSKF